MCVIVLVIVFKYFNGFVFDIVTLEHILTIFFVMQFLNSPQTLAKYHI